MPDLPARPRSAYLRAMPGRRHRLHDRLAVLFLPGPERQAARAERRAEAAIERERYPAVLFDERRRAAVEAERRRWGPYGEWRL
jgi:hypothetical protein